MVVFASVCVELSAELCSAIPGDIPAKVAYLQEELHENYPQICVSQNSNTIQVSGLWEDLTDLHVVLDAWHASYLSSLNQNDCHDVLTASASSTMGLDLQQMGHDVVKSALNPGTSVADTSPTKSNSVLRDFEEKVKTPDDEMNAEAVNTIPESENGMVDKFQDDATGGRPEQMDSSDQRPAFLLNEAIKCEEENVNKYDQAGSTDGEKGLQMITTVNSTNNLSNNDPSYSSTDPQFEDTHNIKAFIKIRTKHKLGIDQEVQTDIPDVIQTIFPAKAGRRRGRKPGKPRKVKSGIPVKRESRQSRNAGISYDESGLTVKKRGVGRPRKNAYQDVLAEEMIPLNTPENVLSNDLDDDDGNVGFESIDLLMENDEKEDLERFDDNEENSLVVIPTAPESHENMGTRSAKKKAMRKVGEMARAESPQQETYKTEKRGRKQKQGPFITREAVDVYMPAEDDNFSDFSCKLCSHATPKRAALKQHYLRCHLERKFQCRTCGKKYSMLKELASHKLTHNRRHKCSFCDKKFATSYLLEGHVERLHLNPKKPAAKNERTEPDKTSCDQCDFVAKSRKSLIDHNIRIHGEKIHPCPICNKKFAMTKDLNQHIKFHSESYQCDECGRQLKSKLALKLHINGIHRGIKLAAKKEYVCDNCGKICRNKTHFKEHMNKEHLHVKPFQCLVCPLSFYTNHSLKCHGRVHSDIREFICDFCGKGFKNRSGLRVHKITHQEIAARPYQCETCHKSFTQRGALVRHERIHSGERPYKCRLCESSFNDYSILRRHVTGVHKLNDRALCGRVDIDPTAVNRGRPKMPGPCFHPQADILNTQAQAEAIAQTALKVAHEMAAATNIVGSMSNYQPPTSVSNMELLPHRQTTASPASTSQQIPTPIDTSTPQDLSQHSLHAMAAASSMEPIQLVHMASDPGHPSTSMSSMSHHNVPTTAHQQQLHASYSNSSTHSHMPLTVVNDIVQSALFEQQQAMEGGYTIGMPVFPSPTVANMHMMQPAHPMHHANLTELQVPRTSSDIGERRGHTQMHRPSS